MMIVEKVYELTEMLKKHSKEFDFDLEFHLIELKEVIEKREQFQKMSKFDKRVMSNEEETCVVFNYKKYRKFYLRKLEELAREELEYMFENEKIVFESGFLSYVEYGFYTNFDGEKFNGWHMRSFDRNLKPKRNSVKVIVLKVKELK